jgi:hypothetical protein
VTHATRVPRLILGSPLVGLTADAVILAYVPIHLLTPLLAITEAARAKPSHAATSRLWPGFKDVDQADPAAAVSALA